MAGILLKPHATFTVDMVVSPISKLDETFSPDVYIHAIPWKVRVRKNVDENVLEVCLHCTKNSNDSPSNWSIAACATITLKSFRDEKNVFRHVEPHVFNPKWDWFGCDLIELEDLLNKNNVQNDAIQLSVEITAEDPNHVERSSLELESIDKNCNCGSAAAFRLTVSNVENLIAVRSPQFIVRGLACDWQVFKDQEHSLGIKLYTISSHKNESCEMTMSAKLLSTKPGIHPIKKSNTQKIEPGECICVEDIISWDEMLKPKNGYVNNGSITLAVKVRANKPVDDGGSNVERNDTAKLLMRLQQAIVNMVISPISKLTEVNSPEVYIHGVPFEVQAFKNEDGKSLAVVLHCSKSDNFSDWAVPVHASVKLLSFNNAKKAFKHYVTPYVFDRISRSFGFPKLIEWDDLWNEENMYVQNDSIEMTIDIVAEDPNYSNRSRLTCERINKSHNTTSTATFRLTVANVANLIAVRSSQFTVFEMPWNLMVYKHQRHRLGVALKSIESHNEVSCETTMTVKLLSSKDNSRATEKTTTEHIENGKILCVGNIISWGELLKPENGFVNNDSITLEVELNVSKPADDPNGKRNKRRRLECSICLDEMNNQEISTTPCGHMFCTDCITKTIEKHGACPLCKEAVQKGDLRCLFLSTLVLRWLCFDCTKF